MKRVPHRTRIGIPAARLWFAARPEARHLLSLNTYRAACDVGPVAGFERVAGHTLVVDITRNEDALLSSYRKNTANEIRRARSDGTTTRMTGDFASFVPFFNDFAARKGLAPLRRSTAEGYRGHGAVAQALDADGRVLAQLLLLVDEPSGRVRVIMASTVEGHTQAERKAIGHANRLLHHDAMVHFGRAGFIAYDMGGYAVDTTDKALEGINRFKRGFGGELVAEAAYRPLPMAAWSRLSRWLRRSRATGRRTAAPTTA